MRRLLVLTTTVASTLILGGGAATAATPNDHNCYGAGQSDAVSGPGGLPGSKVNPAPGFEDPRFPGEGVPTWNGPVTSFFAQQPSSSGNGNFISEFQQTNREANANCGNTGTP